MDTSDVRQWFGEYLDAFAACGRGEGDTASLLASYGVPLLFTTDDGVFALTSDDQVVAAAQRQVDGMRAADYDRSEVLDFEVAVLNSRSALCRGVFSRQRRDGSEISRFTATYLVTEGRVAAAFQRWRFIAPDSARDRLACSGSRARPPRWRVRRKVTSMSPPRMRDSRRSSVGRTAMGVAPLQGLPDLESWRSCGKWRPVAGMQGRMPRRTSCRSLEAAAGWDRSGPRAR